MGDYSQRGPYTSPPEDNMMYAIRMQLKMLRLCLWNILESLLL